MLERLKLLQANKKQFANGSELLNACSNDINFRNEIEALTKHFLHRNPSGCSNCYMDAYLELINTNIQKLKIMSESKFKLKHGVLLKDVVNFDIDKNMTVHNTSDELALYHLKKNPGCSEKFQELPENWEELAEKFDVSVLDASNEEQDPKKEVKTPKKGKSDPKKEVKTTDIKEGEDAENTGENSEKEPEKEEKTE